MVAEKSFLERFTWFLISEPTPEEIMAYRLTPDESDGVDALMQLDKIGRLTPDQRVQLDDYLRTEHVVRMAKLKAVKKIKELGK